MCLHFTPGQNSVPRKHFLFSYYYIGFLSLPSSINLDKRNLHLGLKHCVSVLLPVEKVLELEEVFGRKYTDRIFDLPRGKRLLNTNK